MASMMFNDIDFPTELYKRKSGAFSPLVQDLLDFAPKVARYHAKKREKEQSGSGSDPAAELPEQIPTQQARFAPPPDAQAAADGAATQAGFNWQVAGDVAKAVVDFAKPIVAEVVKHQLYSSEVDKIAGAIRGEPSAASAKERRRMEQEMERIKRREEEREAELREIRERQKAVEEELEREKKRQRQERQKREKEERERQEKERAVAKKAEAGESDAVDSTVALATTAATVAVAGAGALYAAWAGSQKIGEAQFLAQFSALVEQIRSETVPSVRAWIQEREKLGLPVPAIVVSDLEHIEALLDMVDRLDDSADRKMVVPGYFATAMGSAAVAASYVVRQLEGSRALGYLSVAAGALWVVSVWGLRSSSGIAASQRMYAHRIDEVVDLLEGQKHKAAVLQEIEELAQEDMTDILEDEAALEKELEALDKASSSKIAANLPSVSRIPEPVEVRAKEAEQPPKAKARKLEQPLPAGL
ncbi:hypothetical protein DFJ74DRAFT_665897 [Hyaloraphidium curvatum]|nr:hypothetical protein DFJ74DRAFT_665897 [Hyaloraphidium curvatum]